MSEPLVAFLLEQLDVDERVARAAGGGADRAGAGVWTRECGHTGWDGEDLPPSHDLCCVVEGDIHIYDEGGHDTEQADHIAHWDPARVLAEVGAKRRIVETCATLLRMNKSAEHHRAGLAPSRRERHNAEWFLRLMAAPYRDRPGYDPTWAPSPSGR